ncbi:MAG: sensor histidine kinase [Acidimicrobiia bacterium]
MSVPGRLRRSDRVDGAVAVAMAAAISAITSRIPAEDGQRPVDTLAYVCVVVAAGSLAGRRRWPVGVLAVVTGALVTYLLRDYSGGPIYVTFFVALHTMAASLDLRRSVPVAAAATGAVIVAGLLRTGGVHLMWAQVALAGWTAVLVFWAEATRNRRAYLAGLEDRARRLEETREEEARRRVAEERLRIARDMHDVVAHSLASISVQSGVAAHVLDKHPDQARDALLAIRQTSKDALDDLRGTLGLLREGEEAAPRAPAPSLGQLESLATTARRSGLAVDVVVSGRQRPLPAAVEAAAFRIVQESLTNVVRHAGAAAVRVAVTYGPGAVELEVVDDGRGGAGDDAGGHGLRGMRERAAAVGGEVVAGTRPEGGFRVWARMPDEAAVREGA